MAPTRSADGPDYHVARRMPSTWRCRRLSRGLRPDANPPPLRRPSSSVHRSAGLTISVDEMSPSTGVHSVIGSGVAHGIAALSGIGEFSLRTPLPARPTVAGISRRSAGRRCRRSDAGLSPERRASRPGPSPSSRVGGERVAGTDRPLRADDATAQFHLSQSAILRTHCATSSP